MISRVGQRGGGGPSRREVRADASLFAESDHLVLEVVLRSRSARPRTNLVVRPRVVHGPFRLRDEEKHVATLPPRGVSSVVFPLDATGDSPLVEASGSVTLRDGDREESLTIPPVSLDLSFGPLRTADADVEDLAEAASRFFNGSATFRSARSTNEAFRLAREALVRLPMSEVDAVEGRSPAHGRASFHAVDERGRRYAARVVVAPSGSGCTVRLLAFVSDEPTLFGFLRSAQRALAASLGSPHQP